MARKKTIELQQTKNLPNALIIGVNNITGYLTKVLQNRGCTVRVADAYRADLGRFDYIFQFGNFNLIDKAIKEHLLPAGKILFIETDFEANLVKKDKIRIIRIGDISAWQRQEAADKILRAIFSISMPAIVDIRKKLHLPQKPVVPKEPIISTPIVKRSLDQSLSLVRKTRIVHKKRVIFVGLIVAAVMLVTAGTGYRYISSLAQSWQSFRYHLALADWQDVSVDIRQVNQQLAIAKKIHASASKILFPLAKTSLFQDIGNSIETMSDFLTSTDDFLSFSRELFQKSSFLPQGNSITQAEIALLGKKIDSLYITVSSSKAELEKANIPFFDKDALVVLLSGASEKLAAAKETLPLVEKLFFTQAPKDYLMLFQNSMELRPTGGFIGSFALLTVENGKIADFKIEDVYTADGQLKGHIDPPLPIRKYLSQPHFFLRDSNFDPDFVTSAVKAAWFLEKELGKRVDGVIAVNLPFMQKLLRATGELTISDFNKEKIDADNFFFKTHSFTSKDFFPGSTQKKDFLNSVVNALMQKLSFGKQVAWLDLFMAVKQALDEKNILIYSADEETQKFIEEHGWGGRILEVKCVQANNNRMVNNIIAEDECLKDYLSISEANLGVNKANYFVNKSVAIEKKIEADGRIASLVTLSYENTAIPEVFPEATYVNYLRILLPKASSLDSVMLNNASYPTTDIDSEDYSADKTSYGFLVKTAPGNKAVVKIAYTLPYAFTSQTAFYQFFFQKQAGDKNSPLVLSVSFPNGWNLKPVNFKSTSGRDREIYYTTDTSVDRIFVLGVKG